MGIAKCLGFWGGGAPLGLAGEGFFCFGFGCGSSFGGCGGVCLSFGGEGVLGFLTAFDVGGGGLACGGVDGDESLLDGLGVGDGVEGEVGAVVFCGGGAGGDVKKSRIPPRSAA